MIGLLVWALLDFAIQVAFELLFGVLHAFDEDESAWPLAVFLFVSIGLVLGGLTAWLMPARLLAEGPFVGVSLIVVPVLLGAVMEALGALSSSRGRRASHLATWYGGAAMGLGLAVGRLGIMKLAGNA